MFSWEGEWFENLFLPQEIRVTRSVSCLLMFTLWKTEEHNEYILIFDFFGSQFCIYKFQCECLIEKNRFQYIPPDFTFPEQTVILWSVHPKTTHEKSKIDQINVRKSIWEGEIFLHMHNSVHCTRHNFISVCILYMYDDMSFSLNRVYVHG